MTTKADPQLTKALFQTQYAELKRIARSRLRKAPQLTLLDTVGLVSEVFAKLERSAPPAFENDGHFLAYVSTVMRSIVVDYLRSRSAERHGGDSPHDTLDTELMAGLVDNTQSLLDVSGALEELAAVEPRLASVVEMRFFGGFSELEIAQAMGVTDRTVRRDWEKAKLMLTAILRA